MERFKPARDMKIAYQALRDTSETGKYHFLLGSTGVTASAALIAHERLLPALILGGAGLYIGYKALCETVTHYPRLRRKYDNFQEFLEKTDPVTSPTITHIEAAADSHLAQFGDKTSSVRLYLSSEPTYPQKFSFIDQEEVIEHLTHIDIRRKKKKNEDTRYKITVVNKDFDCTLRFRTGITDEGEKTMTIKSSANKNGSRIPTEAEALSLLRALQRPGF